MFVLEQDNDVANNLMARGVRNKRPISKDAENENEAIKLHKLEFLNPDMKLFTDFYPMNELIDFLKKCNKDDVTVRFELYSFL